MGNPPHLLLQLGALRCQLVGRFGAVGLEIVLYMPRCLRYWNLHHLEPGLTLEDPNHRLMAGEVESERAGLINLWGDDAHGGGDVPDSAPHGLELGLEF